MNPSDKIRETSSLPKMVGTYHRRRIISYILDSVDQNGSWGSTDFEDWAPIITALTLELLLRCGLTLDSKWYALKGGQLQETTLRQSIQYINSSIHNDGSFGEDLWDALRLGSIVKTFDLENEISARRQLYGYIDDQLQKKAYRRRDQTWSGPGFLAAAVDYCEKRGQSEQAAKLFEELTTLQSETGEFRGSTTPDGNELASPLWHTSQALITYLERGLSEHDLRVAKIVQWLVEHQAQHGSWRGFSRYEGYYTSYGIIAISRLSSPPSECLNKAISWLKSQMAPSGKVADAGGTIMAAMALSAVEGYSLETKLSILEYHNAEHLNSIASTLKKELSEKDTRLAETQAELKNMKIRYSDAEIVFTKKQAWVIGIVVALGGIIIGVLSFLLSKAG